MDDINEVRLNMAKIEKDVSYIKENISDIKCWIENADQRYASKWTETSLKRINWILITAIIGAVLAFFIKY